MLFEENGDGIESARDSSEGMRVTWALPRDPGRAKGEEKFVDIGEAGFKGEEAKDVERGILRKLGSSSDGTACAASCPDCSCALSGEPLDSERE